MSKEATPVDELSGLPFLIAPNDEALPYLRRGARDSRVYDLNHSFHPKSSWELQGIEGSAVRQSRGQLMMRYDHDAYHDAYDGPELPRTRLARLRTVLFAAADFIPKYVIDVSQGSPLIRAATHTQYERLCTSGEVRVIDPGTVRKFLLHCMKEADTTHINPLLISDFMELPGITTPLNPEVAKRRRDMAHQILSLIMEPVVDPLAIVYAQARKNGMISPALPERAHDFVCTEITGQGREAINRVIARLMAKLHSDKKRETTAEPVKDAVTITSSHSKKDPTPEISESEVGSRDPIAKHLFRLAAGFRPLSSSDNAQA